MSLAAFVADGSILPRESGISQNPMKSAVVFSSADYEGYAFFDSHAAYLSMAVSYTHMVSHPGQELLERSDCEIAGDKLIVRFFVGFPARCV